MATLCLKPQAGPRQEDTVPPHPPLPPSELPAQRSSRTHLVVHGVDAVGAQGRNRLVDEVRPPAVEHAEAQVLAELFGSRSGIQPPEGTEAALGSAQEGRTCVSVAVCGRSAGTRPRRSCDTAVPGGRAAGGRVGGQDWDLLAQQQ